MNIFLSLFTTENLVSRHGFGSPVPRQPAHLHTEANLVFKYRIPPESYGGVHLFILNCHTPSGQSRVYWVTQLRTDGVQYREFAGIGPVNLKVVPNGCCLGRSPWTNYYAPFFPIPTIGMIMYGVITYSRVQINQVRLPILLVVSWVDKMNFSLSPFAPENLVSRDGFGRPVPRRPAYSPHTG